MSQTKTVKCRIVGEGTSFFIGQPIAANATTSSAATIDFKPYVVSGDFSFINNVIDNSGQNPNKSKQYGQKEVSADVTFFAVDNNDPDNPLTILRAAFNDNLAVPIKYTGLMSFDGDMIVENLDEPNPESGEIKIKATLHPCNNYRVWQ